MATRIVLVQHGEKMPEPGDPRLTEVGYQQVADTAQWVEDRYGRSIARVLSSPLRRARETAEPIARRLGTDVTIDDRLVERMNWSLESGLDLPAFLAEWDRASSDRSYQPATGESSTATGERMVAAVHDVALMHPDGTVVVATHGGATVDLLRTLVGDAEVEERAPGLIAEGPEPCAITVLEEQDGGLQVEQVADTAHLARSRRGWWIDETAHAGAEHLDPDYVASYEQKAGFDPADDIEVLLGHGMDADSTVVDLGAGTGVFALAAADHAGRVVAVDVSPAMVDVLQRKVEDSGRANVEVVHSGFLSYEHSGEPADFVSSRNALHQLPDLWKGIALQRVHALMKPGGILRLRDLVFDFEPDEADERLTAWVAGAVDDPTRGFTGPELEAHVRDEFSTWSWLFEPMLERAGFEVLDAHYVRSAHGAYTCRRT